MKLEKHEYVLVEGQTYSKDDIVRIDGEHGQRFLFLHHAINLENGKEWVTVNEVRKGQVGMFRSFHKERQRPLRSKKKAPKVRSVKGNADEIRTWAKANGFTVGDRGRIPKDVRKAFDSRTK